MGSLSVLNVFCTTSGCATTSTSEFITIRIFIIFDFFFWILPIWWSKFRRGVLRDEFLLIFWIEHDHISSQKITYAVEWRSRSYPHIFLKIPQNRVLPLFNIVVRSSSGWVLMVLKVLPSKSLKSGENFKYLHRTHIFNSSWYILHFLPKTPPVVCYVSMHHFSFVTFSTLAWK